MNDLDRGIIEAGRMMKRGYVAVEGNISKIIAVITGALAILLTFAEIAPPSLVTATLGVDLAVMLIASYIIYFSLEDAGERLGKETDEYKAARERYIALVGEIRADMIERLRDYLGRYRSEELRYRTQCMLVYEGLTEGELQRYLDGEKFSGRRARALSKIAGLRPVDISIEMLLGQDGIHTGESVGNPRRTKLTKLILGLIPSTLCLLFTASMIISAKDGIDAGAVISGIVKLSTLPMIGLKGYSRGYAFISEEEIAWIEAKTRLLDAFLLSEGSEKKEDSPE